MCQQNQILYVRLYPSTRFITKTLSSTRNARLLGVEFTKGLVHELKAASLLLPSPELLLLPIGDPLDQLLEGVPFLDLPEEPDVEDGRVLHPPPVSPRRRLVRDVRYVRLEAPPHPRQVARHGVYRAPQPHVPVGVAPPPPPEVRVRTVRHEVVVVLEPGVPELARHLLCPPRVGEVVRADVRRAEGEDPDGAVAREPRVGRGPEREDLGERFA